MKKIALATLLLVGTTAHSYSSSYDDLNAGLSYFDLEQYDNAITWLDKALAPGDLIPDHTRIAYVDRGLAYWTKGDIRQAIADFTSAITANPDHTLAYRHRISAYFATDNLEKALADYDKLRALRPNDLDIAMNYGWLNWQFDHVQNSADAFRTFSEGNAFSWAWLQLANIRLGKPMTGYKEDIESRKWPGHIPRFYLGHLSEADVLKAAEDTGNPGPVCEAHIMTAMWRVVHDDRAGAAPLLKIATEKCKKDSPNGRIARSELEKNESGEKTK
jgi:tetratricopeptide (TPR) repeat protein